MLNWTARLVALSVGLMAAGCHPSYEADDPVWDPDAVGIFRIDLPSGGDAALEDNYEPTGCDEHPWVRATVRYENPMSQEVETYEDVGVRWQGHNVFVDAGTERPGYKLSFDEFVDGREFHGLSHVNLLGSGGDTTGMHERLALELMAEMGVPVERVVHSAVYVDGSFKGIYPNREEPDDHAFLDAHFEGDGGSLYKVKGYCGERASLSWLGDDPTVYEQTHEPKAGTEAADMANDLIPFLACASSDSDDAFVGCIGDHIDVDEWLMEMAVDVALPDVDGMASAGQNFLLYRPEGEKFVVYPWDKDLAFNLGAMNDTTGDIFSLHPSWLENSQPQLANRLRRVYAPEFCSAVLDVADALGTTGDRVDRIEEVMSWWVERDPFLVAPVWRGAVEQLKRDITARRAGVIEQATACQPPSGG